MMPKEVADYRQLAQSVRKVHKHNGPPAKATQPTSRWWAETRAFVDWMRGKQPLPTTRKSHGQEDDFDPENIAPPENRRRRWRFWRKKGDNQDASPKEASSVVIELPLPQGERVTTAKYTFLTFLPRNLYSQFHRVANFYFLFLIILQCVPAISTWSPMWAATPLLVICGVTAGKDAVEDWKRHQSDNRVNYAVVSVFKRAWSAPTPTATHASGASRSRRWANLVAHYHKAIKYLRWRLLWIPVNPPQQDNDDNGNMNDSTDELLDEPSDKDRMAHWKRRFWKDLVVGDIVLLRNDESVPADLLLLNTSDGDGVCFVETKNLDGETNLKLRRGLPMLRAVREPIDLDALMMRVEVTTPRSDLHHFAGRVNVGSDVTPDYPVGTDNLLLRGSIVRNTDWIVAMCVYVGAQTKLALNAGQAPLKRTRIERQMNPQVVLMFCILFVFCLACAITQGYLLSNIILHSPYWISDGSSMYSNAWYSGFLTFWSSLILFQTLIPLSLYITLEMIKSFQAFLINCDRSMYWPEQDLRAQPRAWNLSDDLGQVDFLFSDKTGTLTVNVMEFKAVSIGGTLYSSLGQEDDRLTELLVANLPYPYVPPSKATFTDHRLVEAILRGDSAVHDFVRMLALTHAVLIDTSHKGAVDVDMDDHEWRPHMIQYKAQSPDEAALVQSARDLGFCFLGGSGAGPNERVRVLEWGMVRQFDLLERIEFSSARKRMSIVLADHVDEDVVWLYCKGADNVIYERLAPNPAESTLRTQTTAHLDEFAAQGLRTLCFAKRSMRREVFLDWQRRYHQAKGFAGDSDERDVLISGLEDELETGLMLCGATAIKDKLQEGVPECLESLRLAGIKVWVLTGDKLETAVNIGYASRLLDHRMRVLLIRTANQLKGLLDDANDNINNGEEESMAVEGGALREILGDKHLRSLFLERACRCAAVICCRVSPLQKAKVVELVKRQRGAMTAAIGDGANDVSMIQTADIGIGIATGTEGMQAAMASDYAVGQFRHLGPLFLVHGHWRYQRIGMCTLLCFYKNFAFVFVSVAFQFYCGFTSQYAYDYLYAVFFNLTLTVVPILMLGAFDRDLERATLASVPQAYRHPRKAYSLGRFFAYLLLGCYQAMVCFFVPLWCVQDGGVLGAKGYPESLQAFGSLLAWSVILTVNAVALQNTLAWTAMTWVGQLSAFLGFWVIVLAGSLTWDSTLAGSLYMLALPKTYIVIALCVFFCLAPQLLYRYVVSQWWPRVRDILRELQSMHAVDRAISVSQAAEEDIKKKTPVLPIDTAWESHKPADWDNKGRERVPTTEYLWFPPRSHPELSRWQRIRSRILRTGSKERAVPYRGFAFSTQESEAGDLPSLRHHASNLAPLPKAFSYEERCQRA